MFSDRFNQERWNMLSPILKMEVAIRCIETPYFSKIVEETGLTPTQAHAAQNCLVDRGITNGYGEWQTIGGRWVRVMKIVKESENEYLDELIPMLEAQ